jgi:anti-sigma regulatory factor (Ser/Thr protein kinase)
MNSDGCRHEALIYRDADEFLGAVAPFLRAGLEAEEPALVAVRAANAELLRGELGRDADGIGFVDVEAVGRNPARLVPLWREALGGSESGGRGIGEPVWPGREAAEIDECQRQELMVDAIFADLPGRSLLCSYDEALDDAVLAAVARSHRTVIRDGAAIASTGYVEDADCFAGGFPPHPGRGPGFAFDRTGLFDVRQRVGWAARRAGMPESSTRDLIVAASELATNSIVHGGGSGVLRVWFEADRILVEVEDGGQIADPLAGRIKPEPMQVGGRGLWLANQLCDLVQIRSRRGRTVVRLQMALA